MNSDLCDVCGCCGAGGFRGDGLGTQQHTRIQVTISVNLLKQKQFRYHIVFFINLHITTDVVDIIQNITQQLEPTALKLGRKKNWTSWKQATKC